MFKIKALLFTLSILLLTSTSKGIDPIWESFYSGLGDNSDRYNSVVSGHIQKMAKEAATTKLSQLQLMVQVMYMFVVIQKVIQPT